MNAGAPAAPTKRRCAVEGCESTKIHGGGMCQKHRRRQRLHGDALRTARPAKVKGGCAVEGCERPHHAHGLCRRHREAELGRASSHDGNRNFLRPLDRPDPAPARALRRELERARLFDGSFAFSWAGALRVALGEVRDPRSRSEWERAFASTRSEWRSAFYRIAPSTKLRPFSLLALVDDDEVERRIPRRRAAPSPVAGVRDPRGDAVPRSSASAPPFPA